MRKIWTSVIAAAAVCFGTAVLAAQPSPEIQRMIQREETLNDMCRGGSGDNTEKACDLRDTLVSQLKAKGWCYGHEPQNMAERQWEPCVAANKPAIRARQDESASESVKIGSLGVALRDTMGCPDEKVLRSYLDESITAARANDTVGSKEAIAKALLSGCALVEKANAALVLDTSGIVQPLYRIRLTSNSRAYWVMFDAFGPMERRP